MCPPERGAEAGSRRSQPTYRKPGCKQRTVPVTNILSVYGSGPSVRTHGAARWASALGSPSGSPRTAAWAPGAQMRHGLQTPSRSGHGRLVASTASQGGEALIEPKTGACPLQAGSRAPLCRLAFLGLPSRSVSVGAQSGLTRPHHHAEEPLTLARMIPLAFWQPGTLCPMTTPHTCHVLVAVRYRLTHTYPSTSRLNPCHPTPAVLKSPK